MRLPAWHWWSPVVVGKSMKLFGSGVSPLECSFMYVARRACCTAVGPQSRSMNAKVDNVRSPGQHWSDTKHYLYQHGPWSNSLFNHCFEAQDCDQRTSCVLKQCTQVCLCLACGSPGSGCVQPSYGLCQRNSRQWPSQEKGKADNLLALLQSSHSFLGELKKVVQGSISRFLCFLGFFLWTYRSVPLTSVG